MDSGNHEIFARTPGCERNGVHIFPCIRMTAKVLEINNEAGGLAGLVPGSSMNQFLAISIGGQS
jgi:hypothetical protein